MTHEPGVCCLLCAGCKGISLRNSLPPAASHADAYWASCLTEKVANAPGYGWMLFAECDTMATLAAKLAEDPDAYRRGLVEEQGSVRLAWEQEGSACSWEVQTGTPSLSRRHMPQGPLHQVMQQSKGTGPAFLRALPPPPPLRLYR